MVAAAPRTPLHDETPLWGDPQGGRSTEANQCVGRDEVPRRKLVSDQPRPLEFATIEQLLGRDVEGREHVIG